MKKKLCMFLFLLPMTTTKAQWSQTSCPVNEGISLSTDNVTIFAATGFGGGFHASANLGQTWTAPYSFSSGDYMVSVFNSDGYLYLGGSQGNYRSTDGGITWEQMTTLTAESCVYLKVGSYLFAGTYGGGIFKSPNSGTTWINSSNGLLNEYALALANDPTSIFAATAGGLFKSSDFGTSWQDVTISLNSPSLSSVAFDGTYLLAGGNYCGVYRSSDGGVTWMAANTGLGNTDIRSLYTVGETIFLGCGSGSYYSIDHGANWIGFNSGFPNTYYVQSYCAMGSTLFCGTYTEGIWKRELTGVLNLDQMTESHPIVYPNPSDGEITISNLEPESTIEIYDVIGNTVYSSHLINAVEKVDFKTHSKGIYIYRINTKNQMVSEGKITIQ